MKTITVDKLRSGLAWRTVFHLRGSGFSTLVREAVGFPFTLTVQTTGSPRYAIEAKTLSITGDAIAGVEPVDLLADDRLDQLARFVEAFNQRKGATA